MEDLLQTKWCCAAALMLVVSTTSVSAADTPCFEIYQSNGSGPEGSILLNRCTGQSWLLVGVNAGYGNNSGWYSIPIDTAAEPQPEQKTESDVTAKPE
jgi:hypothetical protein